MRNPFAFLDSQSDVPRETFDRFALYHDLLLKWQPKINLVGPDTVGDSWNRHFLDSLQLVKLLTDKNATMIDMGTGAGFPGLALAVYGYANIHLIESDARKVAFLREVARVTDTKVTIHHERVEKVSIEKVDVVLSRALASLDALVEMSSHHVSRGTFCLFHKGKNYTKEIEDAKSRWQFDYSVTPSITDQQGVLLRLSDIGEK